MNSLAHLNSCGEPCQARFAKVFCADPSIYQAAPGARRNPSPRQCCSFRYSLQVLEKTQTQLSMCEKALQKENSGGEERAEFWEFSRLSCKLLRSTLKQALNEFMDGKRWDPREFELASSFLHSPRGVRSSAGAFAAC